MAAAQAVWNTAELLESIISYLPPLEISVAMRVARSWNATIIRSRMHDRRILRPYTYATPKDMLVPHPSAPGAMPRYISDPQLEPNYAIYSDIPLFRVFGTSYRIYVGESSMPEGGPFDDSYVSIPPCQALALYIDCGIYTQCTVYKKNGIKVRDLREAAYAFIASEFQYGNKRAARNCEIFAAFDIAGDQHSEGDSVWEIEPGWMDCIAFRYMGELERSVRRLPSMRQMFSFLYME